jgi:hypothetical protein
MGGGLLNFDIEWRGGFAKNYKSTFKFCQPPLFSNKWKPPKLLIHHFLFLTREEAMKLRNDENKWINQTPWCDSGQYNIVCEWCDI